MTEKFIWEVRIKKNINGKEIEIVKEFNDPREYEKFMNKMKLDNNSQENDFLNFIDDVFWNNKNIKDNMKTLFYKVWDTVKNNIDEVKKELPEKEVIKDKIKKETEKFVNNIWKFINENILKDVENNKEEKEKVNSEEVVNKYKKIEENIIKEKLLKLKEWLEILKRKKEEFKNDLYIKEKTKEIILNDISNDILKIKNEIDNLTTKLKNL